MDDNIRNLIFQVIDKTISKEDFERLTKLGVSCKGKVVLARYGRNYRGYKAKYAEAAGAVGALLFTDPADSGWGKGLPYPEGGFATHLRAVQNAV